MHRRVAGHLAAPFSIPTEMLSVHRVSATGSEKHRVCQPLPNTSAAICTEGESSGPITLVGESLCQ
jgi:hypothetical protein